MIASYKYQPELYRLKQLVDEDQAIRQEYDDFTSKYKHPAGVRKWIAEKGVPSYDIFGDRPRAKEAQILIKSQTAVILADPRLRQWAWLLVQHMDHDISFQKWFLALLPKNSEEYRYLYDRVAVNTGNPQKYNTQTTTSISENTAESTQERDFQAWYAGIVKKAKEKGIRLNPNPDDPRHFYDYRAAWKAGEDLNAEGHMSSKYKLPGHPRRYIDIDGQTIDTITGKPVKDTVREDVMKQRYLLEKSYTEQDIPEYFYRVFYYSTAHITAERRTQQLEKHIIYGAGGLSDTWKIEELIRHDTVLQMPAKDVLEKNKLSRVLYENPDYLLSNHMQNLKRVTSSDQQHFEARTVETLTSELLWKYVDANANGFDFIFSHIPSFRNTGELLHYIMTAPTRVALDSSTGEKLGQLRKILKTKPQLEIRQYLGQILTLMVPAEYKEEKEWLVKNDPFIIPEHSTISFNDQDWASLDIQTQIENRLRKAGYKVQHNYD